MVFQKKMCYYTVNTIIGADIPSFTSTTCVSLKDHHQVQELGSYNPTFSFHLLYFTTVASVYTLGVRWSGVEYDMGYYGIKILIYLD
jgi:hypothetical protein